VWRPRIWFGTRASSFPTRRGSRTLLWLAGSRPETKARRLRRRWSSAPNLAPFYADPSDEPLIFGQLSLGLLVPLAPDWTSKQASRTLDEPHPAQQNSIFGVVLALPVSQRSHHVDQCDRKLRGRVKFAIEAGQVTHNKFFSEDGSAVGEPRDRVGTQLPEGEPEFKILTADFEQLKLYALGGLEPFYKRERRSRLRVTGISIKALSGDSTARTGIMRRREDVETTPTIYLHPGTVVLWGR
jgi:hypothetical protein